MAKKSVVGPESDNMEAQLIMRSKLVVKAAYQIMRYFFPADWLLPHPDEKVEIAALLQAKYYQTVKITKCKFSKIDFINLFAKRKDEACTCTGMQEMKQ